MKPVDDPAAPVPERSLALLDETPPPLASRRADRAAAAEADGGFWVFGYGSLMWRPGFPFVERRHATLKGFARRFCLWSVRYRGTPTRPGLVLGLDPDPAAETRGVAFRAPGAAAEAVWAYLAERELATAAYFEVTTPVRFTCDPAADAAPRRDARAVAYVIDPAHRQYAGRLSPEDQARIIAASGGPMGPNPEYLFNTVAHLREIGVSDPELEQVAALVAERVGGWPAALSDGAAPELADRIGD